MNKITLECQECGHKFQRALKKYSEVKCPKCKSTDVDLPIDDDRR